MKVSDCQKGPGAHPALPSTLACQSSAVLTKVAIWLGGCRKNLNNDC